MSSQHPLSEAISDSGLANRSQSKPDADDEKRIKVLEHDITALEKEVAKLRSKASVIQEQIKELQAKILEVGGVKLRAMQSKVANTKGLIELAGENIVKAEVAQAKAQRDAEKLDKTISSNTAILEQLQTEYEVVEADLASCQADLEIITSKVQEAQDGMEDVHETLAEAKQELDEKLTYINAFRSLQVSKIGWPALFLILTNMFFRWISSRSWKTTPVSRRRARPS